MGGEGFDIADFFGVKKSVRVTTFTSAPMFRDRLSEIFGEREYDLSICQKMKEQLFEDLRGNHKYDYQW